MSKVLHILSTLIGILVIYIAGEYFGTLVVFIPVFCIAVSYWIINRYANKNKKPMFLALSIIIGHLAWAVVGMTSAMLIQSDVIDELHIDILGSMIDFAVMFILLIWLYFRPGYYSGISNILFSLLEIGAILITISGIDNPILEKAYILHLIIYVITVMALIFGLASIGKIQDTQKNNQFKPPKAS